jgi:two-component system CheB/CheR fusion protein
MDTVLQKKIIPLFHYTLLDGGYLFLGSSESIGQFSELFSPLNSKWKIFKRKKAILDKGVDHIGLPFLRPTVDSLRLEARKDEVSTDVRSMAEKIILEKYSSPCVLVNEKYEIIYFHGDTDRYLTTPKGEARFNILKMARGEIGSKLGIALHKTLKNKKSVTVEGITIKRANKVRIVDLLINPVVEHGLTMVVFEERAGLEKEAKESKKSPAGGESDPQIASLRQELLSSRESLQITIEEFETSSEELKSTNEELQSTNEELQSTNEELETSKEELHSTNEELETVNSELQEKVTELSKAHDDMQNILDSTDIGTIFLDMELCLKRFTPSVSAIFNLIHSDIGRPISDITTNIEYDRLTKDSEEVLRTLIPKESIVKSKGGSWYTMRILPYRTVENLIDGVVITFLDITEVTKIKETAGKLRRLATIVEDSNDAVTVLDPRGKILAWNKGAVQMYGYSEAEALKMRISQIVPSGSKKQSMDMIARIMSGEEVKSYEASRITKSGRALEVWLTVTKLVNDAGEVSAVATTERDITEHKKKITELEKEVKELKRKKRKS